VNEDKATRYQRLKRQAGVISLVWNIVLLAVAMLTGWSTMIRSTAEAIAAHAGPATTHFSVVVAAYVLLLAVMAEAVNFPVSLYSEFMLERRYGLSDQPLRAWLLDQLKSFAVALLLGIAAASIVYFFIRRSPAGWWLPAGVVFALLIVVLANLAPVLLLPLFYGVKPLDRESLRVRLLTLAERAGARVLGAYEWKLGEKTRKANAALTGIGPTRRILVSDTMLAEYTDDEIEVVLAHELAHHVHGDIWKGLVFESALLMGGFYAASRILQLSVTVFGLRGPADVAGLPLLLLAAGAVSLMMLPAAHAVSRAYERSADRFALELTRNPEAFISAMRRLAAQNLAEEHPSRVIQWLFYSHPPIRERIATAENYRR
jgi:STE24 endopeptidase